RARNLDHLVSGCHHLLFYPRCAHPLFFGECFRSRLETSRNRPDYCWGRHDGNGPAATFFPPVYPPSAPRASFAGSVLYRGGYHCDDCRFCCVTSSHLLSPFTL